MFAKHSESDTFVINLGKLELKREHDLNTDNGKARQKPVDLIPSLEHLDEFSPPLSSLIISAFSTVPISRKGSANHSELKSDTWELSSFFFFFTLHMKLRPSRTNFIDQYWLHGSSSPCPLHFSISASTFSHMNYCSSFLGTVSASGLAALSFLHSEAKRRILNLTESFPA